MEAEEPYFSQVGSMKEMRALRVHRGMKSYSKLIRNSGGVTFLGAEVPAVLLLGFRIASGIEMDMIVLLVLSKTTLLHLNKI